MRNRVEELELRRMLAAVPTVSIDGQRFKAYEHEEGATTRILIPVGAPKARVTGAESGTIGAGGTTRALALASNMESPTGFQISLTFSGTGVTDTIRSAFTQAAAKWENIITGDVPDVSGIDDVAISASISPIDGPGKILGQAGPSSLRTGSFIPARGVMQFDSADLTSLANSGRLSDVIFHEMGHVLGVGTIWTNKRLTGGTSTDPQYTGQAALAAYRALGGTGNTVPLENTGGQGTFGAHWRESIFNNEIMTGFLNSGANPASILTIASLVDLGYAVNMAAAEAYAIPGVTPSGIVPELSSTITGTAFRDSNNNGQQDEGESILSGQLIYLDTNNNSRADGGERFVVSGSDGQYTFTNLGAGTHTIRPVLEAGLTQTTSSSVAVEAGQTTTANVGSFDPRVRITGNAFIDANNNGTQDSGELALPARTPLFLDANANNVFDRGEAVTTVSTAGTFTFAGLTAGTYNVMAQLAAGVIKTSPAAAITASAGQNITAHFGVYDTKGTITGTVYLDANNNAEKETEEATAPARTIVFLDANGNGTFDRGERTAVTTATGTFTFGAVLPGSYSLGVIRASTIVQTTTNPVTLTAGATVSGNNIGLFNTNITVTGSVFLDVNQNGERDSGELPISSRVVYFDTNENGALDIGERAALTSTTGAYSFSGLQPGSTKLRVVVPFGFIQTLPTEDQAISLSLAAGNTQTNNNFGLFNTRGTLTGRVFFDSNANGALDAREPFLRNIVIYLDANNNGQQDFTELFARTSTVGSFAFSQIPAGSYTVRMITPAGFRQTSPADSAARTASVTGSTTTTVDAFGQARA